MKKAQLKIQQMTFMLLAVIIFFIMAGLFFIVIQSKDLYKQANLDQEEKALSTIAGIADTAEFSCGEPLCIDTDKLIVLQEKEAYEKFWPLSSLSVIKVYPSGEIVKCTEINYPNCNLFEIYDKDVNDNPVSTFVSLCRKEKQEGYWYNKCELGKIIGGYEIKEPE